MEHITDTLKVAELVIMRQAAKTEFTAHEAARRIERAERIAEAKRRGVPVATYQSVDLKVIARLLRLPI